MNPGDLLQTAVGIASVSGREAAVADYLVGQMASFADEAFVDEAGNAIGRVGRGGVHVLFLGHIDTVAGEVPVRVEEGKLYGRGAVDAKGAFCTAIAAAAALPEETLERLTLTLVGAVEEEAPSSKGARHALTAYPRPDFVVIGEPSGWEAVTLGYKGRLVARLQLEKDNFHSAGEGTTAAEDMVALWQAVRNWADGVNDGVSGNFDRVQVALQSIASHGDGLNQTAEAVVGLRLPPGLSPTEAQDAVTRACGGVLPYPPSLVFTGHEAAYRGPKDTPLSRAFRLAIRAAGGTPRFKLKTGTSDMNVVAPHWDVPILAYGPGDSSLDHRPDEHLELAEYERAIGVLREALVLLVK